MLKIRLQNIQFIRLFNLPLKRFSANSKMGEELVMFESREEKDIRYEDECFYFEREWKKLVNEKVLKHQDYSSPDLSDYQQKEVDIMINKCSHLSILEKQYFEYILNKKYMQNWNVDISKPNIFKLNNEPLINSKIDSLNPNWEATQKILSDLAPFIASGYFQGGAAVAAAPVTSKATEEKAEAKKEPEKLKAKVDVKLASFDAAKKINLIKEVRGLFNLGLKEAKELVEKTPVVLKAGAPREEGEEIIKKLKDAGAVIELV